MPESKIKYSPKKGIGTKNNNKQNFVKETLNIIITNFYRHLPRHHFHASV